MLTNNLGYPRIGANRELKRACESFWAGKITLEELKKNGLQLREMNWKTQKDSGIDLIPSNDFSFYDQVLDLSLMLGVIPRRFRDLSDLDSMELYFAMARGYQKNGYDITALEMTKWFDTNYHYLVPEFVIDQQFRVGNSKVLQEFLEAKKLGIITKPVLVGPVTFLWLGKEKETEFNRMDLIDRLLPEYVAILKELEQAGAEWIQIDEPYLVTDIDEELKEVYKRVYAQLVRECPNLKILLTTYFDGLLDNTSLVLSLPVAGFHIDLVRAPEQLEAVLSVVASNTYLSLGVVDGRNIWKNNYKDSLALMKRAAEILPEERLMIASSCSLLHAPVDLETEREGSRLHPEVRTWLSFARQKLSELADLKLLFQSNEQGVIEIFKKNKEIHERRSSFLEAESGKNAFLAKLSLKDGYRDHPYSKRALLQKERLQLPLFPTTTIGSFPQTMEVRALRSEWKKGVLTNAEYEARMKSAIQSTITLQEEIGLDVLVHGEFERNDMVEYFGEMLNGFTFTSNGWVQSYGSRCVKPPIIYGEVSRSNAMTVAWSVYAASLTSKHVKGMLTGPVTILQWSFVRDDQPRNETCLEIAAAIREEVSDLEAAGIRIIQIDEPAIREGLPLRKGAQDHYLKWAVWAFRIASCGVSDATQIHTHMCYSDFNDIIEWIAEMDADVITIECSRSQMELLDAFANFQYPNEIGPGVYDIHSPRIPTKEEMVSLLSKAETYIPAERIWVNPDCGLKTRGWEETIAALKTMVEAAEVARQQVNQVV
ncbi:5-methyltetrahydropteroyltriglutamate--homocysteine S-methyltransferase [Robertkochia solimangrovi]|uniref:5-methyltetrahydropteroyltriglutamate-- homocysteine S-methyltransferase n=1 Tax=Robertkochia solimangrovi TaxID=2213046 RepID=UPI00117D6482|nr:5-methyltetrahydropteroyltriglutamate--homocysteine S-methyltransferase [Robertkochia solimangrovi]TRZ44293.1 5-methyltetrahydropteroyltriglutamate--homocysteine S-methyltransferase [Robertkochia solimangrovi]